MRETEARTPGVEPLGFVAPLDALRAVAIAMVLAFHFSIPGVPFRSAGYLGVDLFFVLSGFLITKSLLDERRRRHGISIRAFYVRRGLRILPLVAVLLVIGAIGVLTLSRANFFRPDPIAFPALAGFWINWLAIANPRSVGMFSPTWSLAIEVQFYVVWPLVFAFLLWRRVRLRYAGMLLAAAVATSTLVRASIWNGAPPELPETVPVYYRYLNALGRGQAWEHWYRGSFSHMDGLFIGALAALAMASPSVRTRFAARPAATNALLLGAIAVGSAIVIAASRTGFPDFLPIWGLSLFEVCIALVIVCLVSQPKTILGPVLTLTPVLWVGVHSYGIYMLQFPVLAFVRKYNHGASTPWIALAITLGAAALSYRYVEQPALRRKGRSRRGAVLDHAVA